MERLTEKFKYGRNILRNGIADVFHVGFGRFFEGDAVDKLAEYEDLEEQGLLLKLPVAKGGKVYAFTYLYNKARSVEEIDVLEISDRRIWAGNYCFGVEDIGAVVFLTKPKLRKH